MNPLPPDLHHTVYRSTVTAAAVNSSLAIIAGGGDIVQNQQFFPKEDMQLINVVGHGVGMSNPRILTPSLFRIAPQYIRPWNIVAALPTDFNNADYSGNPVIMRDREGIDCQSGNTDAGNQAEVMQITLRKGMRPVPRGDRRTIFATGTTTLVANTWTNVALTFADRIPEGLYEIVGMQAFSATGYAARLIMPGGFYRPGVPIIPTVGLKPPANLKYDQWGGWGQFEQSILPGIEFLATAGDTAQSVWLDIVKVSN